MPELRFTKEHEYIRVDGDRGTVGITDYAQAQLESVKAASEIYAPVAGEVVAINAELQDVPGRVNEDPFGTGWFLQIKVANPAELANLMDEAAYDDFLKTLE
jgi:glycine cleavage system H protein